MKHEKLDSLGQLFGCYFHQDWTEEFESAHAAIQAILTAESKDKIEAGVKELDALLAKHLTEAGLREILVTEVGCYFDPTSLGLGYRQWLSQVREELAKK